MHALLREIADEDRAHDPFGASMNALGAICDVYQVFAGDPNDIAPVGYSPGLAGPVIEYHPETGEGSYQADIVTGMNEGLTLGDLEYAIRVLDRYIDFVKLAGRDY